VNHKVIANYREVKEMNRNKLIIPLYTAVILLGAAVLIMERNNPISFQVQKEENETAILTESKDKIPWCTIEVKDKESAIVLETEENVMVEKKLWKSCDSYEQLASVSGIEIDTHNLQLNDVTYKHIMTSAAEIAGKTDKYNIRIRKRIKGQDEDLYKDLKKMYDSNEIGGNFITLYGDGESTYNLALWENEDYSFSVYVKDKGASFGDIVKIIREVS
jgi:hypothetical protein